MLTYPGRGRGLCFSFFVSAPACPYISHIRIAPRAGVHRPPAPCRAPEGRGETAARTQPCTRTFSPSAPSALTLYPHACITRRHASPACPPRSARRPRRSSKRSRWRSRCAGAWSRCNGLATCHASARAVTRRCSGWTGVVSGTWCVLVHPGAI